MAFDGLCCFSQKGLAVKSRPSLLADFWIIAFEHFHYVTTSCHLRKIVLFSAKSRRPGPRISCNDTASFFLSLFLQHLRNSKTFKCLIYFQNLPTQSLVGMMWQKTAENYSQIYPFLKDTVKDNLTA